MNVKGGAMPVYGYRPRLSVRDSAIVRLEIDISTFLHSAFDMYKDDYLAELKTIKTILHNEGIIGRLNDKGFLFLPEQVNTNIINMTTIVPEIELAVPIFLQLVCEQEKQTKQGK